MRRALAIGCIAVVFAGALVAGALARQSDSGEASPQSIDSGPLPAGVESPLLLVNTGNLEAADQIVSDRWPIPRFAPAKLPRELTWQEDPFEAKYWRFIFYSLRPLRHLLWAYYRTDNPRYRDKLLDVIESYLAEDLARTDVDSERFDDDHAAAFRALTLVNAHGKLSASDDWPAELQEPLERSLEKLGVFLEHEHNYAANNNHGFAQSVALWAIAIQFPQLSKASEWAALAEARYVALVEKTVDPDGVQIENSPFYHFYSLRFAREIADWTERTGINLPARVEWRIDSMVGYATAIIRPNGEIPLLGSSVALNAHGLTGPTWETLGKEEPGFDYYRTKREVGEPDPRRSMLFRSSGQAILRSRPLAPELASHRSHVVLDAGPYRTSHSQLDALSLTFYSGRRTLITDSGLLTYAQRDKRYAHFEGTRSHNTVVVDGKDQRLGHARPRHQASGPHWAYQSGTHALYDGVRHKRGVLLLDQDILLVVDELNSKRRHRYTQTWHSRPEFTFDESEPGEHQALLRNDKGRGRLRIFQADLGPLERQHFRGSEEPFQGWYSRVYGEALPAPTLEFSKTKKNARFVTALLGADPSETPPTLTTDNSPETVMACLEVGPTAYQVVIDKLAVKGESVDVQRAKNVGCGDDGRLRGSGS